MTTNTYSDLRVIPISPLLRKFLKSGCAATLLQQIHYWVNNPKSAGYVCKDGHHWVYNTLESWKAQIMYATSTIEDAITKLKDLDFIHVINPKGFDRTSHYRVNYAAISAYLKSCGETDEAVAASFPGMCKTDFTVSKSPIPRSAEEHIQRVPTEITHKEFAAEAAPKPKTKKKVEISLSEEDSQNPWRSKLAAFMGKVVQTNTHNDYYTDPGEVLAKKAQEAIYRQTYAPYAEVPPETAVKSLCSRYLSSKHNPHQDKKHMTALCNWLKQSPHTRLKPLVDAFLAIKTSRAEVHTASYVLRGLSTLPCYNRG